MIQQYLYLLGAWAIHCDGADCHMEALSLSEAGVLSVAKSDGWAIDGLKHECPDCVAGNNPAEAIKVAGEPGIRQQPASCSGRAGAVRLWVICRASHTAPLYHAPPK